jgi:hypothetical protein
MANTTKADKEQKRSDEAAYRAEDKANQERQEKRENEAAEAEAVAKDDAAIAAAGPQAAPSKLAADSIALEVPSESYSVAMMKFKAAVDAWLDEVQRHGKHRGETLLLVAPKE